MKRIAHRGNLYGPDSALENRPEYVLDALTKGYDVEVDVWYNPFLEKGSPWYLGHDEPMYQIPDGFLAIPGLWLHAKNLEAMDHLGEWAGNYFWHQSDMLALTSHFFLWTCDRVCYGDRCVFMITDEQTALHGDWVLDVWAGACHDWWELL